MSTDPVGSVAHPQQEKLEKKLGLFDVYAISTGAMFSSGFFLLPGLAAAQAGPAVILSYFLASILMLPAMLSMAELSTAMPRSGGPYYFIDRALGPMAGTIGGIGEWVALILKSAFALIGMGAYLAIFVQVPVEPLAIALTIAFGVLNIMGAKETSALQNLLVTALVGIMAFYTLFGILKVVGMDMTVLLAEQFTPFAPFGASGVIGTIGLVFISYAGLTKVTSVAEEVKNPDRNIPLGMVLSLLTATSIYVVGVFLMVALLPAPVLHASLTPVATAGEVFLGWLPYSMGVTLIVIAAIAAFASTGNAGILSASRYPFAMARDGLLTPDFAKIGRFKTPTLAVGVTFSLMIVAIVALDVSEVAKLGSAVQLLIFALINFAVIVMRESRIPSYAPSYWSPWYPWTQVAGIVTAFYLITEIGAMSFALTTLLVVASAAWFRFYGRSRVSREGAIYHVFARLGRKRFEGLDFELREIMKERTLLEVDPYEAKVAGASVIDLEVDVSYEQVVAAATERLARKLPYSQDELETMFLHSNHIGATSVSHGAALPDLRLPRVTETELVLVRVRDGVELSLSETFQMDPSEGRNRVFAFIFIVSPQNQAGFHLRMLAELVSRIDEDTFQGEWINAETELDLREVLLRHERYIALTLKPGSKAEGLIGKQIKDISGLLLGSVLLALVQRGGDSIVPHGGTVLLEGDRITVIGSPEDIGSMYREYRSPRG